MKTKGIVKKIDEKKKVKAINQLNDETEKKEQKNKRGSNHVDVRQAP